MLMQAFLQDLGIGPDPAGDNTLKPTTKTGTSTPPKGVVPNEIVLERGHSSIAMATGTSIPLVVHAYENTPSNQRLSVDSPKLEFQCDPDGMLKYTNEGLLTAEGSGTATIWFEAPDSGAESNRVLVESVECNMATISNLPDRLLLQGESFRLNVVFESASGPRWDLLVEASVDEPDMGRIDRQGRFKAGLNEGAATIRFRIGGGNDRTNWLVCRTNIGPKRVAEPEPEIRGGNGIPLILLCGTTVPGYEEYPRRTIDASIHEPTIIDFLPEFEQVIFINPDSAESRQVRRGKGGVKGTSSIGSKTFMLFLASKCFEVLKRLRVRQEMKGEALTDMKIREYFSEAEIQCAPFIERAYDIAVEMAEEWSATYE